MANKKFTVEEIAKICDKDRETIRRWRNRGVRGVRLEADTSDVKKGIPLTFSKEAIRKFIEKNPNPQLEKALQDDDCVESSITAHGAEESLYEDDPVIVQLKERQKSLMAQLETTNAALLAAINAAKSLNKEGE